MNFTSAYFTALYQGVLDFRSFQTTQKYLFAALCVCTVTLILTVLLVIVRFSVKRAKPEKAYRVPSWYVCCVAGVIVSLILLFLSKEAASGFTLKALLTSIVSTAQTFLLDSSVFEVRRFTADMSTGVLDFETLTLMLFALAPFLTFRTIVLIFRDTFTGTLYKLAFYKKTHVFSELNEKSLCLAKSLYHNARFFNKPLMIFANVDKTESGFQDSLITGLKSMQVLRTKKGITNMWLSGTSFIYLINQDEDINVSDAINLSHNGKPKQKLYVFSTKKSASLLINLHNNSHEKKYSPIILINEARMAAYDLLWKHPLFEARYKGNQFNAMVIGTGTYGTEIAQTILWCGQSINTSLSLTVVDRIGGGAVNLKELFEVDCPGACEKITDITDITSFHRKTKINFESEIDVKTSKLNTLFESHPDTNYIVVCLGDDELTYNTAVQARTYYERMRLQSLGTEEVYNTTGSSDCPVIIAIIRKESNYDLIEKALDVDDNSVKYHIFPFGNNSYIFREENIANWNIDLTAKNLHRVYKKLTMKEAEYSDKVADAQYSTNIELEKRSNWAAALHSIYKLNDIGIKVKSQKTGKVLSVYEVSQRLEDNKDILAELEHLRWSVFYLLEGFDEWDVCRDETPNGKNTIRIKMFPKKQNKEKTETKNYISKIHTNLTAYENLDENALAYNYDMTLAIGEALRDSYIARSKNKGELYFVDLFGDKPAKDESAVDEVTQTV